VWISDFWTEPAAWPSCASLASRGYECSLVRVLSPGEFAPPAGAGPMLLVDSETGERLRVGGGEAAARAFEAAAGAHAAELEAFAARRRCRLLEADASRGFEETALELLRRGRLVEQA
jgi:hypothetical protein